jgi:hypothetical protein
MWRKGRRSRPRFLGKMLAKEAAGGMPIIYAFHVFI